MKIIIIICMLLFFPAISQAEIGVAVKLGHISYEKTKSSEYVGNTCYDSELSYGGFLRWVKDNWIARFDIDYNKTGNTFQRSIPYPYEQIELRQTNYSLTMGRYFSFLYLLGGVCFTNNDGEIEQYPSNLFSYEFKDSFGTTAIAGIEKKWKDWFIFLEGKYTWQDMEVSFKNSSIEEDTNRFGIYIGTGFKF